MHLSFETFMKTLLLQLAFVIIQLSEVYKAQEWCIALPSFPFTYFVGSGTYNPISVAQDRTICQNECFSQSMLFSGVYKNSYCFCSNSLASTTNITISTCSTNDGIYVMTASSTNALVIFDMSMTSSTFPPSNSSISMTPTLYMVNPPGFSLSYQYSYRDRINVWENSATPSVVQRIINSPGVYEIRAQALKTYNKNMVEQVSKQFLVFENLTNPNLTCQPYGVILLVAVCKLTMTSGSRLTGNILVNGVLSENISFTDPPYERAGPVPTYFNTDFIGTSSAGVNLPNAVFQYNGTVMYIELNAVQTGTIYLMLLQPVCPTLYCFAQYACGTTPTCSSLLTCTSPYCSLTRSCSAACNNRLLKAENVTSLPAMNLNVVQYVQYTIPTVGYQVVTLASPWPVFPGYRLGFYSGTGNMIATTAVRTGETNNFFYNGQYGYTLGTALAYNWFNPTAVSHQMSAVAIPSRVYNLRFMFNTTGLYNFTINLASNLQNNSTLLATIDIGLNINDTNITTPYSAVTNLTKSIILLPLTGSYLQYVWTFGDGSTSNTTVPYVNHTYTVHGIYNLTVFVYNNVVNRTNSFNMSVKDPVVISYFNGTTASNPNTTINFNLGITGDAYNCTLSGASFTNVTQSVGNLSFKGSWPLEGYYNLRLDCASDVSYAYALWTQIILNNITGLQFANLGGTINQSTILQFNWTTGSNATFEFLFNNVTTMVTTNQVTFNGSSAPVLVTNISNVIGVLRATNPISEIILVANLSFNEPIVGLQIIPNYIFVAINGTMFFNVSMAQGSTVYIYIDFNDGTNTNYTGPVLMRWINNYNVSHLFNSSGTYNVTVTANNTANRVVAFTPMYCLGLLGTYSMNVSQTYMKIGDNLQLRINRTSGNNPVMANMSINWMDGVTTFIPYNTFNETAVYNHAYSVNGVYNVSMTLINPLNFANASQLVTVLNPIINFRCSNSPPNTWSGGIMSFNVLIDSGDQIKLTLYPGDAGTPQVTSVNVSAVNTLVILNYTYSTIGNYSGNVTACNPLGCANWTFSTQIQYKVNLADFAVTSNGNIEFNKQNTSITLTFSGTNFPTNMTATYTYTDSNIPVVIPMAQSQMPYVQIRNLTKTGYMNVSIVLSNLVSNQSYSIIVGAWQKFQNFSITATWGPGNNPGFGSTQTMFPVQQMLYFAPTLKGTGTVDYYVFMYTQINNASNIYKCNATLVNGAFPFMYTTVGTFNISMNAINPIDNAFASLLITIGGGLKDTTIIPPLYTLYPNYYGFVTLSWSIISPTSCICVDLGNGTKNIYGANSGCTNCPNYNYTNIQPVNSMIKMTVRYPVQGDYLIVVYVYSALDSVTVNRTIPITSVQCSMPVVSMANLTYTSTYTPQQGKRGSQIIVNAVIVDIPCIVTKNNFKTWTATLIDPTYFKVLKTIDLKPIPTYNNTQLIIPPLFLQYGLYQLTFTVLMDKNVTTYTFLNSSITYLQVGPSPIVVGMIAGGLTLINRGTAQTICLYPTNYSRDPDLVTQVFSTWTWTWKCKNQLENDSVTNIVSPQPAGYTNYPSPRKGCFGTGPGIVKFQGSTCFAGSNMEANNSYVMSLTASTADGRTGSAQLILQIVDGIPANIAISCTRPLLCPVKQDDDFAFGELAINPSDALLINSTCTLSTGAACSAGSWQILFQNITAYPNVTITSIPFSSPLTNPGTLVRGIQSVQMSITPAFFTTFSTTSRFQACYVSKDPNGQGQACIQYFINPLPYNVSCSLDHSVITQTDTVCCNCINGLATYNYRMYVNSSGQLTTLGFSNTGNFCSIIPYQQNVQTYLVRVTNSNGGYVDYTVAQIQVQTLSNKDINSIMQTLLSGTDSTLQLVNAKGDLQAMSQIYLKYLSVLTVSSQNMMQGIFGSATNGSKLNFGGTGYTQKTVVQGGMTIDNLDATKQAAYESNRDKMSGLINQMSSQLVDMVPGDIQSLHLVSSVVSSMTTSFDNLNRLGQDAVSNKLMQLAGNLKTMQTTATKDDIHTIGSNLLTATFQSDTASNSQINNGISRDIKQSKDNFLDYDTNIESSGASYMSVSDPNAASNSLTLETNADFQTTVSTKFGSNSDTTINMVTKCLRDVSVLGDEPTTLMSAQMQYYQQKAKISDLNGATYNKGRSTIQLPDICQALKSSDCSNSNNPLSIEIMATPNNRKVAATNPNAGGLPIPIATDTVSINLFSGSNDGESSAKVSGGNQQFQISLARDPSYLPPPFSTGAPNVTLLQIPSPQAVPGTGDLMSGPTIYKPQLIMHQFSLTGSDQSIHFQMQFASFNQCTQFLVVARLFSPPTVNVLPDGTNDSVNAFSFWGMIPTNTQYCNGTAPANQPDPFTFFISNVAYATQKAAILSTQPSYSSSLNTLYFGVRELTVPEWNSYTPNNRPYPYSYYDQVNTSYKIRIYSSGCYSNSDGFSSGWSTSGCQVGPLTTPMVTQCLCTHLTTFISGFIVAPNTINFNYVFSNFDLSKNPTLFITEGVIYIFFILLLIWARRKDIKDLEKIGVTPLLDNDPTDMYLYEIAVDTSIRNNAGTKSKVYFILSGENDETEARHIEDPKRSILQRGNVDRFLLAVPRSLGPLQYIRLWHDNSGKGPSASWYCNYFGVTDLQTKEKFHFLVNSWFAVEEDDGQVDRLIAVASSEELLLFGELFARKMKADLTENHLWLSIMARPPESRFTRVERVACCLLLMFLTMLTTCMFYKSAGPSKVADNALIIGPLAITPSEVWIGLVSGIIGFLPLFIVIDLFRKSQLRHGHANKLREAVEEHFQVSIDSGQNDGLTHSKANLLNNEEINSMRPDTPGYRAPDQVDVQVSSGDIKTESKKPEVQKVRKRLFPWWVRIISWIILVSVLIVACFFTTMYGIQFGDMACKKWISSMFISFFASVILIQPIKVIVMAVIFTLLCKNSSAFDDDYVDEEDELMNELGQRYGLMKDEEYMHEDLYTSPMKPHRRLIQPPSKDEIEKARDYRLREMKMFDVLREISFYVVFFITLLLVTYSFRDPQSYILKTEMTKVFVTPSNQNWQFLGINREDQFWDWALGVLVPGLRAPLWYNNQPQLYQRGFISDRSQRLMGYAVMRQVRVKKDSCSVYSYVKNIVKKCYGAYNILTEDTANYSIGWKTNGNFSQEFSYQSASALNGFPYLGAMNIYSGGGYVYQFRSDVATLYKEVAALRDSHWIDFHTRAVFIEFTTYNPNINLFAICTFLLELPGSGGFWPSYRIEPANLLGVYSSGVTAFEIFCQALYGVFIFVMIIKEVRNIMKQKWTYFKQFWNWVDVFLIGGSFACVAAFAFIRTGTGQLTTMFSQTAGDAYMKFQYVGFWNEYMGYLTSFIVFAATIKFIKLLRFNRRIGMLGAVLSYCSKDMKQFFIIFLIMFMAFVMVFYSLFMDSLYRYHTFLHSTESSMQIALGKFEFLELYQREPIFGPIVFAFYVIFIIFVMLNMFIAILTEGFAVVKADNDMQSNEFEIIEFLMAKFIMFTGITNTKFGHKMIKTSLTDQLYKEIDERELMAKVNSFPDKVDQLLNHISHIIGTGEGDHTQKKGFGGTSFEDKFGPTTRISGGDNGMEEYQNSRPVTARSIIFSARNDRQMTPLGK